MTPTIASSTAANFNLASEVLVTTLTSTRATLAYAEVVVGSVGNPLNTAGRQTLTLRVLRDDVPAGIGGTTIKTLASNTILRAASYCDRAAVGTVYKIYVTSSNASDTSVAVQVNLVDATPAMSINITNGAVETDAVSRTQSKADVSALATQASVDALPSAASIASAVWSAGTRTLSAIADSTGITTLLSRITDAVATRLTTVARLDDLPAVPTAASNATAVRNELVTELGRMDAAVSSRLDAAGAYSSAMAALDAYDPPTRAEATADKDAILAATPTINAADIRGAIGMAAANLDDQLDAIAVAGGTGAYVVTITVDDGSSALQNATVRLTEGANSFTATTNASGVATFSLDAATCTVSITKSGYAFTPTALAVSGTTSQTYSMTAVSIPPPSDPEECACWLVTRDQRGRVLGSISLAFRPIAMPGATGSVFSADPIVVTSDASTGVLAIDLPKQSIYEIRAADAPLGSPSQRVTIGTASDQALPAWITPYST